MKSETAASNRIEPTSLTRAVGLRVRAMREKAGMTQVELAEIIGYKDSSSVTFIEQGRNNIKLDMVPLLCAVLGMSPNDLFGWDGGMR